MNHHQHLLTRLAVALVAVAPGVALGTSNEASATASLVPSNAVYALGGPDTPLPMSYTTSFDAAAVVVTADGLVSSIACPVEFAATVTEGAGSITGAGGGSIAASTAVPCTVSLVLGDGAPATVTVVASERDSFNAELASDSQVVALEEVEVDATVSDVTLTGGTYHPAEPRSIGDELTRSVTFEMLAPRALSFTVPAGTALSGCAAGNASAVTCVMTRTLSLDDLATGTAPMAPTLFVDGFPVSHPAADTAVPSERRLVVDATASPQVVRVGEPVTIQAVVGNVGSVDLTTLALGGAGIEGATCGGLDPATLTLVGGESVTCTATHLATSADIDNVTPVTVRAAAAFGVDSDLVDDDPISPNDVDAVTLVAPYSVLASEIAASLSLGSAVAFTDDAGSDALTMTLTVSSAGALSNAAVTVPVAPTPGVSIGGCDTVAADQCVVTLGSVEGGRTVTRAFDVMIDTAGLPNVDGMEIGGQLTADGGIAVAVTPAIVRTAGIAADVVDSVVEATGSSAIFQIDLVVAAGHPVTVMIAPSAARSSILTACTDSVGAPVPVSESADGALLGVLPGGMSLTCSFEQDVVDADRTTGTMPVGAVVLATAGNTDVERSVESDLATMALVVAAGDAPAPPLHGYSVTGSSERPNTVTYEFELLAYGDLTAGGIESLTADFGGSDSYSCTRRTGADPVRLACTGMHAITHADLALGSYTAMIEVSVGASAVSGASIVMDTPFESFDVLLTELSAPVGSRGYRAGETIRLLAQLRNLGSLPVRLDSLASSLPVGPATTSGALTESVASCGSGVAMAPGATLDCDISIVVPVGFRGPLVTVTIVTAQFGAIEYAISLAFDPVAAPAAAPPTQTPVGTLPATGSGPQRLVQLAFGLSLLGVLLRRSSARVASCPA